MSLKNSGKQEFAKGLEEMEKGNHTEAAEWWDKAANKGGHTLARFNLGVAYAFGIGVEQDYSTAHKLFEICAMSGFEPARNARDMMQKHLYSDKQI